MIKRALILAAGRGERIGDPETPNCLARVGSSTLIDRTLRVLARAGIRKVGIVVGWQGGRLRAALEAGRGERAAAGLEELEIFENPDWEGPNGLSLQAARSFVTERTLLVMADQIAAPSLVAALCASSATGDQTVVGVDRDLARVFDIEDATKVKLRGAKVVAIGKGLTATDGVSTGLFVMSPALLRALDGLRRPSLTEGVQAAAAAGLVEAHDVEQRLWQDVDSPQMRLHAEWLLRVYGDELARPDVNAAPPSPEADTLALVARLILLRDQTFHQGQRVGLR